MTKPIVVIQNFVNAPKNFKMRSKFLKNVIRDKNIRVEFGMY